VLGRSFRRADGAFHSGDGGDRVEANPHMHLLEACLAWSAVGRDPGWTEWSRELAALSLARFQDPLSGALVEARGADGSWLAATAGGHVEPGHLYEWAWLLLGAPGSARSAREAALRLIDLAETRGVVRGLAVNRLRPDLSVLDAEARLWPQTERLKACQLAWRRTGEERYLAAAADAAAATLGYLATPTPGLWFDLRRRDGSFAPSPVFASTFYHLVCAIGAIRAD
jgi:mannose-6-phosphate isomerase